MRYTHESVVVGFVVALAVFACVYMVASVTFRLSWLFWVPAGVFAGVYVGRRVLRTLR